VTAAHLDSRLVKAAFQSWVAVLSSLLPLSAHADIAIELKTEGGDRIEVSGLPSGVLASIAENIRDRVACEKVLSLYVRSEKSPSPAPIIGDYGVELGRLVFRPRFPLNPRLRYQAVFDSSSLALKEFEVQRLVKQITLPDRPRGMSTVVDAVYPSCDVVPENQLKFYIHFSAPMSRGDSYRHIRLLDDNGRTVDAPYLELAEELWDESCTRLTLLFDPGRVKRDLKPHDEVGGALVAGRTYTLVIDDDWLDANSSPLGKGFRKSFRVTKPDTLQPDPGRWKLTLPHADTRDLLVVEFDEPLDHAMLEHVIRIAGAENRPIDGRIAIDQHESRWTFLPTTPWGAGRYNLLVDPRLEDLAGNSIERPFEIHRPIASSTKTPHRTVEFTIQPN